jgi:Homodimerisation domain of SGTA
MSEKQQRLVLSIIEFLNQSIRDGTIREEDKESLEVAGTFSCSYSLHNAHQSLPHQFNVSERLSASTWQTKSR